MASVADSPDGPLKSTIGAAVRAVALAISALPAPAMIIGGIAVIARGAPRLTRDVDATVAGGTIELPALLDALRAYEVVPRIPDVMAFAAANQVVLLTHRPSGVDVDVSIAWLPFELEALAAAEHLVIAGAEVAVARAEDLIIYKAGHRQHGTIERLGSPMASEPKARSVVFRVWEAARARPSVHAGITHSCRS